MKSTSHHVYDLENTFKRMIDGKDNRGTQELFFDLDRVKNSKDFRAHIQGVYKLDGLEKYIVTGSTLKYPGYFYIINNRQGLRNKKTKKSYIPIETKNKEYSHPGGIQVEDDILVVGNEKMNWTKIGTQDDNSVIKFYDISQPDNITDIGLNIYRNQKNQKASGVAIIRRRNEYIVSVRAKDYLDFYSLARDVKSSKKYRPVNRINLRSTAKKRFNAAQSIQLFKNEFDHLYLFAMTSNEVHLYRLSISESPTQITKFKSLRHIYTKKFNPIGKAKIRWASCLNFVPVKPHPNGGVDGYFELITTARKTSNLDGMEKRILIYNKIR